MGTLTVTATELQTHFGEYLKKVMEGNELEVVRRGIPVATMIPPAPRAASVSSTLVGIAAANISIGEARQERLGRQ